MAKSKALRDSVKALRAKLGGRVVPGTKGMDLGPARKAGGKKIKPMNAPRANERTRAKEFRGGKAGGTDKRPYVGKGGAPKAKGVETKFGALRERGAGTKADPARVVGPKGGFHSNMTPEQKAKAGAKFNELVGKGRSPRYAAAAAHVHATGAGAAG